MSTENKFVLWFREISLADRLQVGGKGGSLGELARAAIPIPDGFVVTTEAFNVFLNAIDPEGSIRASLAKLDPDDYGTLETHCADIRRRIEETELPWDTHSAELPWDTHHEMLWDTHQAIMDAANKLGEGEPLAVRSSATSEDSEDASFAGLQDTYLWVRGNDEVIRMVRRCWASLYNPESVSYRLRLKLPEDQLAMGVVVQRMVDARAAGVMFTRSPTTGDRSVVTLEATWGLGSSLVSGEVTPDKYVINKITGEISQRAVASKLLAHVPIESGGVEVQEVAADKQNVACLSDAEIKALVETAKQVEKHYDAPQDIEWAINQHNEILLLQSRPETVWASKDKTPVAKPADKPFNHIFDVLGGRKQ